MNIATERAHVCRAGAIAKMAAFCAALLMLFPIVSAAQPSTPDQVADIIRAAHTATSAEVFLVPDTLLTGRRIGPEDIPKIGCKYLVETAKIGELLTIIDRAKVQGSDLPDGKLREVRFMIRVLKRDSELMTMVLSRFPSEDDRLHGLVNGLPASASRDLLPSLRSWVKSLAPPTHPKYTTCP